MRISEWARQTDARWPGLIVVALVVAQVWPVVRGFSGVQFHGLGDPGIYWDWVTEASASGHWPIVDDAWVYPPGALVPMLLLIWAPSWPVALLLWACLSLVLNLVVIRRLILFGRRGRRAAWWWVGFVGLAGALAVSRLESVTGPLTILALTSVASRPAVAVGLVTFAGWIKVAPFVWLVPLTVFRVIRLKTAALGFAVVTIAVTLPFLVLGAGVRILSFRSEQAGRGLQSESFWALPLQYAFTFDGGPAPEYDSALNVVQYRGPSAEWLGRAGDVVLPLLALAALAVVARAAWRTRAREIPFDLVAASAVVLTSALILGNKVGSPQYSLWLGPAIVGVLAFGTDRARARRWALAGLALAISTQIQYPLAFGSVLHGTPFGFAVLLVRFALVGYLGASAIAALAGSGSGGVGSPRERPADDTADPIPGDERQPQRRL